MSKHASTLVPTNLRFLLPLLRIPSILSPLLKGFAVLKSAPTVPVIEVVNSGLISLLGQSVLIYCTSFIYYGTLSGVNNDCIELSNPYIVYDTGPHNAKTFTDAQKIQSETWFVNRAQIESFGLTSIKPA